MTTTPVGRFSRVIDAASLLLVVAGIALFAWAFMEMRILRDAPHDPTAPLFSYRARYDALSKLSYLGLALTGSGVVVAIAAALHHRRTRAPGG